MLILGELRTRISIVAVVVRTACQILSIGATITLMPTFSPAAKCVTWKPDVRPNLPDVNDLFVPSSISKFFFQKK